MEGMEGWRGLNHFFSLHIVHSLLTVQYELHVLVLQNLTHELLLCTSFECVLKSCVCVYTLFLMCFSRAFWVKYL